MFAWRRLRYPVWSDVPTRSSGGRNLALGRRGYIAGRSLKFTWWPSLHGAILSRVMPPEVDRATALSLINPPRGSNYRVGEYVRFEALMGELIRCGLDNNLHVLDCLDACEQPNQAH